MFFFVLFFYIKILGKFCHNFMITYVPTVDVKRSSWSVIVLNPSYLLLRSIHSGILSVLLGQCDCVQSQGSHSDMDLTFSSMMFRSLFTHHWEGGLYLSLSRSLFPCLQPKCIWSICTILHFSTRRIPHVNSAPV